MAIQVVCPGCYARFKVSDKFAGMSGPCPKCKKIITIPAAADEVKVHAPEEFAHGGRGTGGKLALKPIARFETKLSAVAVTGIVASVIGVVAVAWLAGPIFKEHWWARAVGLLLISPALVFAPYTFLRDQEAEPHRGKPLFVRTAICAVVYAMMWVVFGYSSGFVVGADPWNWLLYAPPFVVTGGLVALACYDLDFSSGCLHYAFYALATILLRWIAGMGWIWEATVG